PRSDQLQITNYINVSAPCSYQWQKEITKKLVEFIIQYVQPLYILQVDAFRNLLLTCEPGYRIPCDKTVKGILYLAYKWNKEQLRSLLSDNIIVQGQRLHAMQQKHSQQGHQSSENEHTNPIDVLTDVKTRWSSTYYAWKRILELYNYIRLIYIDLLSKHDRASKKEGEKLEHLCLNLEEREFLQQMLGLLELIEYNINTVENLPLVNISSILQKYNSKGKAEAASMVRELYYDMNSSYQPTSITIRDKDNNLLSSDND
ncbi:3798_t:CDS:2, partial [Gigaspora margarita]